MGEGRHSSRRSPGTPGLRRQGWRRTRCLVRMTTAAMAASLVLVGVAQAAVPTNTGQPTVSGNRNLPVVRMHLGDCVYHTSYWHGRHHRYLYDG
jgi:hypothetical protein